MWCVFGIFWFPSYVVRRVLFDIPTLGRARLRLAVGRVVIPTARGSLVLFFVCLAILLAVWIAFLPNTCTRGLHLVVVVWGLGLVLSWRQRRVGVFRFFWGRTILWGWDVGVAATLFVLYRLRARHFGRGMSRSR